MLSYVVVHILLLIHMLPYVVADIADTSNLTSTAHIVVFILFVIFVIVTATQIYVNVH